MEGTRVLGYLGLTLRFSCVKSSKLLGHPESLFLYSASLARVTVVYVKPHEDPWL